MSLQVKIYFVVIPFSFLSLSPPISSPSPVVLTSVSAELRLQQTELIKKKKERKKSAYSPNHSASPPTLPSYPTPPSLPPSQHPPRLLALAFSQTITTSRNSTEWPSEGSGLFHIYTL